MTAQIPDRSQFVELPNPRAAACIGKQAFATPQLAHEIVARRRSRKAREVYRCPYCGRFHVGRPT